MNRAPKYSREYDLLERTQYNTLYWATILIYVDAVFLFVRL